MGITEEKALSALFPLFLCGIAAGMLYDLIRILRVGCRLQRYTKSGCRLDRVAFPLIGVEDTGRKRVLPPVCRMLFVAMGDVLFSLVAGCLFSIFLAHFADGVFRWFFLAVSLLGFWGYQMSIGRFVMLLSEWIAALLRVLLRYGIWLIRLPGRLMLRLGRAGMRLGKRYVLRPILARERLRRCRRYTDVIQARLPVDMRMYNERE